MKEILTAAQAAREIGCTAQKVRMRMKLGLWDLGEVIPAKKLGRVYSDEYNVHRRKLEKFLGRPIKEVNPNDLYPIPAPAADVPAAESAD